MFCPRCGNIKIEKFTNNRPVADFFCPKCESQYELKSKRNRFGDKITDGAYNTMIERIISNTNPDFFLLSYEPAKHMVISLIIVPKHFFVPNIIEKRRPLAETAKRAGWTGCNILLSAIPEQGYISIIKNGVAEEREIVVARLNRARALEIRDVNSRGWLIDVLNCVNAIEDSIFTLDQVYEFESVLSAKHPDNNNVKAKIRQQLQFLRDKGYIEFLDRGRYRKI
jgi:type II restriction enzyme